MSKRARDSGGGDEDDEAFDPMAFYKQQQAAMLSQAAQHVEQSREEISRAQQVKEKPRSVELFKKQMAHIFSGAGCAGVCGEEAKKERRHCRLYVSEIHV